MAIVKVIKIEGDTKGAQKSFNDLGTIIQEQKDITIEFEKELSRLQQQLASTSKGNLAQQKITKDRIVDLKGALKDQRISLKELNNEKSKQVKTDKLTFEGATRNYGAIQLLDQVTGGLASQVRAAVDASRLFGVTTKATTVATTAQAGATTSATAANTGFNLSLKATRTALIATGFGAFIVLLGLAVAYWDDIEEFITGANAEIEKHNKKLQDNVDSNTDILKLLKLQEEILGEQGVSLDDILTKQLGVLNYQLSSALALAQSKKELLEIAKLEAERELRLSRAAGRRNKRLKSATETEFEQGTIDDIKKLAEESLAAEIQVKELTLAIIKLTKRRGGVGEEPEAPEKDPDKLDPIDALLKKLEDETLIGLESNQRAFERERDRVEGIEEIKRNAFEENALAALNREESAELAKLDALHASEEAYNIVIAFYAKKRGEISDKEGDEAIALEEKIQKGKDDIRDSSIQNISNGIGLIKSLAGENEALQKAAIIADSAVGVAKVIINTQAANAQATAIYGTIAPPVAAGLILRNKISAGIGIAANLVATKTALSAIGSGGGGVAPPTPSAGGGTSAPSFNLVEGTSSNQLQETIQQDRQPIEAFVVSQNVTTSQELSRNIVRSNSIG